MQNLHDEESTLRLYFDDIAESTPLSREREVELAEQIKNGDDRARDEMIRSNLRFVVDVAKCILLFFIVFISIPERNFYDKSNKAKRLLYLL